MHIASTIRLRGGFTLIELLVVVAIIGIIASVVLASLNAARIKGRNAARLSGIHSLRNAFHLSLASGVSLPSTSGVNACVSTSCYDGWVANAANGTVDTFLAPSLPQKPSDPVGGNRGYGGYMYINPITPAGLPSGAYIYYMMEPPSSCGAGTVYNPGANYVQCVLKID